MIQSIGVRAALLSVVLLVISLGLWELSSFTPEASGGLDDGTIGRYVHLSSIDPFVREGDRVSAERNPARWVPPSRCGMLFV